MSENIQTARRGGKNLRTVEWFNEVCPVGTPVYYWPGERAGEPRQSVTRSEAWLLGGHTPVVMVEGYAGGIALSHVMGRPRPHHHRRDEDGMSEDMGWRIVIGLLCIAIACAVVGLFAAVVAAVMTW